MKLVTLMINNQQDVPIDEMRILTSRFDFVIYKGLGAIRAKIGPTSDVDKMFSKMYSQYVLFINKYS
jgi:hypothetical protein